MSHGTQKQNRRSLRLRPPIGQPVAPVRPLRLGAFPRRRTLLRLVPMHFGGLPQIGQLAQTIAGTSADCSALHSCHIRAHPQDVVLGVSCATRSRTKKRLAASFGKRTMILSLCRNHSARNHLMGLAVECQPASACCKPPTRTSSLASRRRST